MKWGAGILLMAAFAGLAPAGHAAGQRFEIGVLGGFSASTVAWKTSPLGTQLETLRRRKAATGGVYLELGATGRISGRVEALFARKGFTEIEDDGTSTIAVDYLELPVLVGVALRPATRRVVPELFAGPWIAFEARCRADATAGDISVSFDCDEVPGDPVLRRTTDWGVTVGGGVSLRAPGPSRASVHVRYSAGLRNIDAEAAVDNIDAHHRGIAATVALGLPFGP